jgi:16S rRNA A1518/A1519 N6-dimethyltransferase RsmA/KsgA/DIM1 with predicted DNA glycosylase/AP lyase activity
VTDDEAITRLADADRDQYFLSAPDKLALLVEAAGIRPTDRVVEIGAGIGSVARSLPPSASLTLVELDHRLTDVLRASAPHAEVIQGDALSILQDIPCDVLLSNLPRRPTRDLIAMMPDLTFRAAVVAMDRSFDLGELRRHFKVAVVTSVSGGDFKPAQPVESLLVRFDRIRSR